MKRKSILRYVKKLGRTVFTTREVYAVSGRSLSSVVQGLNHLCDIGALVKIRRGVWAEPPLERLSPLSVIPYLPAGERTYLSFISALHLHGIIEQIPQTVTCASLSHTRTLQTAIGTFSIHRISPAFFFGFDWCNGTGDFLVAEPEKALLDCMYLSGRKGGRFRYFPEMSFPRSFSFAKARLWANEIDDMRLRTLVVRRLDEIRGSRS